MCCQTHEQLLKTQNKLLYEYLRLTKKKPDKYTI
ncbi:hypothetical protein HMPREF1536_00821 [Parabacteroides gordonii MS-1 = DSM 23371]|uniref:Uncharacterized protein n=1 Tax=Parabacteroides gordonii MS-1 = DSM 23371 TaxID=1203610 RepID=A0A0F5JNW4_9BACT|nr:hypothetical protein HMPREF1536_00821 [Parabacteroides gordonii MS-1 = DSM 23371]